MGSSNKERPIVDGVESRDHLAFHLLLPAQSSCLRVERDHLTLSAKHKEQSVSDQGVTDIAQRSPFPAALPGRCPAPAPGAGKPASAGWVKSIAARYYDHWHL